MNANATRSSENKRWMSGAAALGGAGTMVGAAAVEKLIADIQSTDDNVRGAAWQSAASVGSPAVKSLAALMTDPNLEVARSAKHAIWKIVRHAGRPKADKERKAVQAELIVLLNADYATVVRREALWMLSEIGDASTVQKIARLLQQVEVREDARCALERMPSSRAIRALEQALKTVPEDFRPAVANSLRVRGHRISGYPSRKLQPSRETSVKAKG